MKLNIKEKIIMKKILKSSNSVEYFKKRNNLMFEDFPMSKSCLKTLTENRLILYDEYQKNVFFVNNSIEIDKNYFVFNKIEFGYSVEHLNDLNSNSFNIFATDEDTLKKKLDWYIDGGIPLIYKKQYNQYIVYIINSNNVLCGSSAYDCEKLIDYITYNISKRNFLKLEQKIISKTEKIIRFQLIKYDW